MIGLKSIIFQLTILLLTLSVFAQEKIHLSGTVINDGGEPLPFASVYISNGMTGTITNPQGKFTLSLMAIPRQDTICVSHVGYKLFCQRIEILLNKPSTITLSEVVTNISDVVVEGKRVPNVDQIILQVRKNLKKNYPTTPFKLKSFYRQSKFVNGEYVSLKEAAVDIYAKDHKVSPRQFTDEILMVNEFRTSLDFFDKELDTRLDPPMKINPIKGVLLQNGVKYIKHNNVLWRKDYQLDSIIHWQGKEHYVISLPQPKSVTLYVDTESYAIRKFECNQDLTQSQTIIDKVYQDSLKSKLRHVFFSMEFKEVNGKFFPFFMEFIIHASIENLSLGNTIYDRVLTQRLLVTDIQTHDVMLPSIKEQTENTIFDNLKLQYDDNFWDNYNIIQLTPIEEGLLSDLQKELSLEEQFKTSSVNFTEEPRTLLSIPESKEDLTKFRTIMEEVHTGLYTYISGQKWNIMLDSLYRALNEPKSLDQLYSLISYAIAQVGNGHTQALLPAWWHQKKRAVFPLRVRYIQDKLLVEESFDPELNIPRGSQIISINGRLPEDIRKQMWPLLSTDGFRENYKYNWFSLLYATHLALVLDNTNEYLIEYISPQQENNMVKHPGLQTSLKSFYESLMSGDINIQNAHNLQFDNKSRYAWLEIHDSSTLMDSLEHYFRTVKEANVQSLVIDLRGHLGLIEDCHPSILYSYFVDKPFKFFEYFRVKSNNYQLFDEDFTYAPYATSLKEIKEEYFDKLKPCTEGYFLWEGEPCSGVNEPGKYLFEGNVYILVDGFTFSASTDFVAKMSQLNNVTIIGQETGGAKNSFISGFMPRLTLPNSGITVRIPTWQTLVCCSQADELTGQGVRPDYEVAQTISDFVEGRDTVKEYVMKLLP